MREQAKTTQQKTKQPLKIFKPELKKVMYLKILNM